MVPWAKWSRLPSAAAASLNPSTNFPGMVTVEKVGGAYTQELRHILTAHAEATGSPRAQELLDHFDDAVQRFCMVVSPEYKRKLEGV